MNKIDSYDRSWKSIFTPQLGESFFTHLDYDLDTDHQTFHPANAWFLSECMRLAYLDNTPQRHKIAAAAQLETCAIADCDDIHATLWRHIPTQQYILCFRGTREFKNWLSNIDAAPCQWPYPGRIHSGFFESFCRCWQELRDAIDYSQHSIICCGHSLGAAMASIAAIYTQANALYTIGCPRIGNQEFCKQFTDSENLNTHRICNSLDIVTHLPPQSQRFGFQHIGPAIWLGEKQRKRDRFKERLTHIHKLFSSPEHIADHAPINYSLRLAEMYKK